MSRYDYDHGDDYADFDEIDFAEPGSNSALRAALHPHSQFLCIKPRHKLCTMSSCRRCRNIDLR